MDKEYKIEDLLIERNKLLYEEVSKSLKITLKKMDFWGSQTIQKEVLIAYSDSIHPSSCFTHELLHAKYHLKGLTIPTIYNRKNLSNELFVFIFNQLSHHKFFKEFCEMGFKKEEFLHESDIKQVKIEAERVISQLEKEFSEVGELNGSISLLTPYLMLISPHDKTNTSLDYINRLKAIGKETFFETIDSILLEWTNQSSYDSSFTFARIMKACNYQEIGFSINGEKEICYSSKV